MASGEAGALRPRRVAVLRALKLGDLLCAVPAFRAFRAAWPDADIVLVGLPWARTFAGRYACYLSGFREFPGYPGLPEREPDILRIPSFLAELQAERFDLAVQLHGSGPFVNPLTVLFGARRTAGFYLPGDSCPDPELFLPWPDHGLEVCRLLRLVEHLGLPVCGEHLEFPLRSEDSRALASIPGTRELPAGGYVCLHPGASVPERRWPAGRFAAVGRALASRGRTLVLTGSGAETGLTAAVARGVRAPVLDLAGRTELGTLAALLSRARLLICNDTGVSHLAGALGVPSVVLSTGDNPARWAPADTRRHRVLCDDKGVPVEEVLAEAEMLLAASKEEGGWPGPSAVKPRHSAHDRGAAPGLRGLSPGHPVDAS
jgi:ADP-heptose:LPS heptosyltransferase